MTDVFIWRHCPIISAPAFRDHAWETNWEKDSVSQKALLELENESFLCIRYAGLLTDENSGITECYEFDTLEEAEKVYYEL